MKKLTRKQWLVALLVSLLIAGSLCNLAIAYFICLPMASAFRLHKEDQWAVEQFHVLATSAFFIALTSGLILGICLPIAYRWGRGGKRGLVGNSDAEPGAAPNGGPATPPGISGVMDGPPSVS
jgi:hypothetical protein